MPRIIILEGCRSAGVSTHAVALATSLMKNGVQAFALQHPEVAADTALDLRIRRRANHFAEARIQADGAGAVAVLDRGPLDECVRARVSRDRVLEEATEYLRGGFNVGSTSTLILDAHDDDLDARMGAASMSVGDLRLEYRHRSMWRTIKGSRCNTSKPDWAVKQDVMRWAMQELGLSEAR